MDINSHKIRFLGTMEIPEPLDEGKEYHIAAFGQVRGSSTDDLDTGFWDKTYKFRLNRVEFLKSTGEVMKSKDNKRKSQKLRGAIYGWQVEHGDDTDSQEFYEGFMNWCIGNVGRLIPYWKAEREKEG